MPSKGQLERQVKRLRDQVATLTDTNEKNDAELAQSYAEIQSLRDLIASKETEITELRRRLEIGHEPPTLLTLPPEIRDMIYRLALCTHDAKLIEPIYLNERFIGEPGNITYPEPVEPRYPPDSDDEDAGISKTFSDWEDEEGSMASDE